MQNKLVKVRIGSLNPKPLQNELGEVRAPQPAGWSPMREM
jgi:hypothetical protein